MRVIGLLLVALLGALIAGPLSANDVAPRHPLLEKLMERWQARPLTDDTAPASRQGLFVRGQGQSLHLDQGGRDLVLYIPTMPKPEGTRPLLVVLHGGLGNAEQIQGYIGLEPYADRHGFLIAYLNGTPIAPMLSERREGWNAGDCCGWPAHQGIDDVGYITTAVHALINRYGVDPRRVFGTGHSNGAMMTERMLCETDLYQGAAVYSGALESKAASCPFARGRSILALHGARDENVPPEGGHTRAGLNRETDYRSQAYTRNMFVHAGATYTLEMLANATHRPESINADLLKSEHVTLPQKIVSFLNLDH